MILMARLHGFKFPFPHYMPVDDPFPIVERIVAELKKGKPVVLESTTSKCVRVSLCAQQHGIDLTGVVVYGLGEPSTQTKISIIEASGIKFLNWYEAAETTIIGMPCKNPSDHTDVHLLSHDITLIQRPQDIFDQTVNAFYFTSLLPTNPKMLLNVQLDDFGIIEERDCGCPLHQMGFTTHIRQVSSFRKLTGEGVTLVGSDMVHILEHVLPSHFGGSLLDYQLVEEENEQGFTKLVLYVDPSVQIADENALLEAFLDAMKHSMPSVRLAQAEYRTGDVVAIRREKPFVTSRGKHFPIRTLNIKS
jgi:phenylacetate-coenzyme A ligase PaaK-like adenylate-forming protein